MNTRAQARTPGSSNEKANHWTLISLFAFAICAFGVLLLITRIDPSPSPTNWHIYLTVLALAAAGFAALLPGAIKFEVPNALKASGALAVFAVILWLGENKAPPDQVNLAMNSFLNFPSDSGPSSPFDSDVYVYVNDKLAKADVLPSHTASPAKEDPQRSDTIKVMRGAGGLRIDFDKLLARDRIYVVVRSDNGEWRSDDLVIPESNFTMRRH